MKIHPSLAEQYPFEGNSFKTKSGFNLHYLDEGEGKGVPTLFLHGNPTWSFFYRRLILALREHGRCIVPYHIGCGLSDKPAYPDFQYNLESHGQNIIDLLDHLKIDRIRLVVHDWGGAIGLSAFRNQPERIEKIVEDKTKTAFEISIKCAHSCSVLIAKASSYEAVVRLMEAVSAG